MGNSSLETTKVSVEVKAVTDDALLLDDGITEVWFPKSQIFDERVNAIQRDEYVPDLRVAYWLAKRKGLS